MLYPGHYICYKIHMALTKSILRSLEICWYLCCVALKLKKNWNCCILMYKIWIFDILIFAGNERFITFKTGYLTNMHIIPCLIEIRINFITYLIKNNSMFLYSYKNTDSQIILTLKKNENSQSLRGISTFWIYFAFFQLLIP